MSCLQDVEERSRGPIPFCLEDGPPFEAHSTEQVGFGRLDRHQRGPLCGNAGDDLLDLLLAIRREVARAIG